MHLSINTRSTKNHRKARPLRFEVFYTPAKNLFTYHFTIEWNHFAPMFFSRDFLKHSKLVVTELSVFKSIRYFRRILGVYTWFCCCIFFSKKYKKKIASGIWIFPKICYVVKNTSELIISELVFFKMALAFSFSFASALFYDHLFDIECCFIS